MKPSFRVLLRNLFGSVRPRTVTQRRPVQLQLQTLEDRLVPTAHTFTVTTVLDNDVAHPGLMSLRDAVNAANTDGNPADVDVIKFAGGLAGKTIKLVQGELDITESVKIKGLGAGALAVSGEGNSRIFNLIGGEGSPNEVTITGLTLKNGNDQVAGNPEIDGGGAIGTSGFGLNFSGPASVDSLTVRNCVLNNNQTDGVGGAIAVTGGSLTIQDTTLSSNVAGHEGGAILFDDSGNDVTLRMDHTTLSNNSTTREQGGGLCIQGGHATINSCTFVGNVAGNEGGAIISRPTGSEPDVRTNAPDTLIQNTTIYRNTASGGDGGGVLTRGGTLTLLNDTIDQNQAPNGEGGGVYNGGETANILNTIVAADTDQTGANDISSGDSSSSTYNVQYSLIQAVVPGTINGTNAHNLFSVDPGLAGLAVNSGPTPMLTQQLLPGSPALRSGSVRLLHGLTVDELGNPRTVNGQFVDMGAVNGNFFPNHRTRT